MIIKLFKRVLQPQVFRLISKHRLQIVSPKNLYSFRLLSPTIISNKRWQHTAVTNTCWKCSKERHNKLDIVCDNEQCKAIQPPTKNTDIFQLLALGSPNFDINEGLLKRNYLQLQRITHPDSFGQSSEKEHKFAVTQSALISKAYQTLKNPLTRAKYMLKLAGHEAIDLKALNNPSLLMEVMDSIEELEQCQTKDQVEEIKKINEDNFKSTLQRLSESFNQKDYHRVKENIVKLQYWQNIQQAIQNWEPGKRIEMHHF